MRSPIRGDIYSPSMAELNINSEEFAKELSKKCPDILIENDEIALIK